MSEDRIWDDVRLAKARLEKKITYWNKEEYEKKKENVLKGYSNIIKGKLSEIIAYLFLESMGFIVGEYDITVDLLESKKDMERRIKVNNEYFKNISLGKGKINYWESFLRRKEYFDGLEQKFNEINNKWGSEFLNYLLKLKTKYDELGIENKTARYIPDLIAKKDNERYIVEVKSASATLRKHQLTALKISSELGFIPILITIPMECKYEFTEGKPILEFL